MRKELIYAIALAGVLCVPARGESELGPIGPKLRAQVLSQMGEYGLQRRDSLKPLLETMYPVYPVNSAQQIFMLIDEADREGMGLAGRLAAGEIGEAMLKVNWVMAALLGKREMESLTVEYGKVGERNEELLFEMTEAESDMHVWGPSFWDVLEVPGDPYSAGLAAMAVEINLLRSIIGPVDDPTGLANKALEHASDDLMIVASMIRWAAH